MERNITAELLEWKNMERNRMPLVLYGARQVGKTYALQNFESIIRISYISILKGCRLSLNFSMVI